METQGLLDVYRRSTAPVSEHDACAIVASIRTSGESTHGNLKRTIEALGKMGHRSGDVQSEGDGCGLLTDIPRRIWAAILDEIGRPAWLADDKRFFVGHLMIPTGHRAHLQTWQSKVLRCFTGHDVDLLLERPGFTRREALGRLARAQEPVFWQIAGVVNGRQSEQPHSLPAVEQTLFEIAKAIEWQTPVHVASLSNHSVVYKVRGSVETLYHYYPELRNRDFTSAITIGHARYSTNTTTAFERVQPFSLLGHNGEINTIDRLREQMMLLGGESVPGGSDSQDLNRLIETLIHQHNFDMIEALELAFPPILSEVDRLPPAIRRVYRYYRLAFGPYAQGPAAIVARHGDLCIGSVDALGLRPLWFGETEKECFFSSEKGVVPMDLLNGDPKPLAPGEKLAVRIRRDQGVTKLDHAEIQHHVSTEAERRFGQMDTFTMTQLPINDPPARSCSVDREGATAFPRTTANPTTLAAFGWTRDDLSWAQDLGRLGRDPIASMGFDGPLAALSGEIQNVPDYIKEQVAVVTNPAIDREREQEHFSTQAIIGPRPPLAAPESEVAPPSSCVVLGSPILLDDLYPASNGTSASGLSLEAYQALASSHQTRHLNDLIAAFPPHRVRVLSLATESKEPIRHAAQRLVQEAVDATSRGVHLIILDDGQPFVNQRGWVPPHLAVAMIDKALRSVNSDPLNVVVGRRSVGLVVRSNALRNLHDIIVALGLGADAVAPTMLLTVASNPGVATIAATTDTDAAAAQLRQRLDRALTALRAGIEKITSTMGIHELRGYGRIFSTIGVSHSLVELLDVPSFVGGAERGLTWESLDRETEQRQRLMADEKAAPARVPRFTPLLMRSLQQLLSGEGDSVAAFQKLREQERRRPVALRHVIGFNSPAQAASQPRAGRVDATITGHDLPFVIASMSFGSQSEIAFRAYAEAARQLNIITLNGEGGEIEDLMGSYPQHRGQQVASGRFGVNINLLNASNLLEIKIGQGAKPGEGGHLPGSKVSPKVARARHVSPGIDLISPSNHHDIYSIEDLAQFIEELKTANPKARVAVKIPVVPDVGVIAVGVAKAGADIINLTGYDGGTGAARAHSIRHVGLPAEIGVVEAHRALIASGMRERVELWADGGIRSPDDIVKLLCLGANRIGLGTLAMIALGCRMCRNCHSGECPVGITTQIETEEEATARGLKAFDAQNLPRAVEGLINLLGAFGDEVRRIAADLGIFRLQDLVGRADLLEQTAHFEQLNLQDLLTPAGMALAQPPRPTGTVALRRPRNHLTTVVSNVMMEALAAGETQVVFEDEHVTPVDRALGTHLAGALRRYQRGWDWLPGHGGIGGQPESWRPPVANNGYDPGSVEAAHLRFYASSVPGNGLGAFSCAPVKITVEGGAQDGVGKGLYGGRIVILKGYNHDGIRIDGSVGKGLGYGAIKGTLIVQGNADSRACVRLSGADVIIGGEIREPVQDHLGLIGARANVKGFLCEYMTAGRVLVLGDPGPWICAGMTGGILYLRRQPEMNLDETALQRRIARGADVVLRPVAPEDADNLHVLLSTYANELAENHQPEASANVTALLERWSSQFVKIVPRRVVETAYAKD